MVDESAFLGADPIQNGASFLQVNMITVLVFPFIESILLYLLRSALLSPNLRREFYEGVSKIFRTESISK
jgi:hypothetical protein